MEFSPVIAHRGASLMAPENTLAAFKAAKKLGCRWVEFDVMLSKDDVPVVIHDETLNRTTNGEGEVSAFDFSQLQQLDAGSWFDPQFAGEKIPSFEGVLKWCVDNHMQANIELKSYEADLIKTASLTSALLKSIWPKDHPPPLISSFNWPLLAAFANCDHHYPKGLLMDEWRHDWEKSAKTMACVSVHLNEALATKERVTAIKNKGYQVLCYTVNQKTRAKALWALGVSAVFTDDPFALLPQE